jgi:hypothetical protein
MGRGGSKYMRISSPTLSSYEDPDFTLHQPTVTPTACTNRACSPPRRTHSVASRAPLSDLHNTQSYRLSLAKSIVQQCCHWSCDERPTSKKQSTNLLQPHINVRQSTSVRLHIDNRPHTAHSIGLFGPFSATTSLHKEIPVELSY